MKNYLIASKASKSSAGFTLPELLIGAAITGVVIAAAGFGLVAITGANERAEDQNQRRMELNRALDFVAEEVKMARSIQVDTDIDVQASLAPNFPSDCDNPDDDVHCALILEIPGVNRRVIYYVAPPPNDSPWLGPRVIYRWGPNFNANGTYSNSANWTVEPLVDRIVGNRATHSNCPTVPINWSPNLSADDRDSFYACVQPTAVGNATGRVAEIFILGDLAPEDPLPVSTRAFARSTPP